MEKTDDLVRLAQRGDVDAFERLARKYAPMLYRVAFCVVGNAEDAQDVSQRALMSAWQGLDTFRADAAFSTWLYQIVRRHALNSVKRSAGVARLRPDVDVADSRRGPVELYQERETVSDVQAAVASLPAVQRDVVRMYHFEQLSYAQIAHAVAISEPSVRSHLFRARRALAGTLVGCR